MNINEVDSNEILELRECLKNYRDTNNSLKAALLRIANFDENQTFINAGKVSANGEMMRIAREAIHDENRLSIYKQTLRSRVMRQYKLEG